jgi:hypothetical protein
MNRAFKFLLAITTVSLMAFTFMPSDNSKSYPIPPVNENSLFYINRTKNTNAIVYEINKMPDGKINPEDPIRVFWIRYATDSTTEDLTAIQRTYAYGVHAKRLKEGSNSFLVQLVAYKKRNIFLMPVPNSNRYAALMNINGKMAELKRIFVSISGGTFWFPKVDYIELTGRDPSSHQSVVERFVP